MKLFLSFIFSCFMDKSKNTKFMLDYDWEGNPFPGIAQKIKTVSIGFFTGG